MPIIAYKGMDKNMQCRGFQYEIGKECETAIAHACQQGFHACEIPLDVFILAIKAAIVDGITLKPDIWYTLKNGEFVEAE